MTHPDDRYTNLYHRATARALQEVADDLENDVVPNSVRTFADLHDHVDANEYGGFTSFDNAVDLGDPADMGIVNAVQSTVSLVLTLTHGEYRTARVAALRAAARRVEPTYAGLVPLVRQSDHDRETLAVQGRHIADLIDKAYGPLDPAKVRAELDHGEHHYDLGGMAAMVCQGRYIDGHPMTDAAARVAFAILAEGHPSE